MAPSIMQQRGLASLITVPYVCIILYLQWRTRSTKVVEQQWYPSNALAPPIYSGPLARVESLATELRVVCIVYSVYVFILSCHAFLFHVPQASPRCWLYTLHILLLEYSRGSLSLSLPI